MSVRFGLLVPHFGVDSHADVLMEGSILAETLGFDSLWVRDHLVFRPHDMEGSNNHFVEPLATLAYLAGATNRIGLGTATLIPTRHPIQMAQGVASLSWLSGRHIDLGFGSGRFDHEFEAIGLGGVDRTKLAAEQLDLAKRLWAGEEVTHHSDAYQFDRVRLSPQPTQPIRLWWAGGAPASARFAVERCDGWLPARLDLRTYEVRVGKIREQCAALGRPRIGLGNIPITSVAGSRSEALAQINLRGLLDHANNLRFVVRPPSGSFEKAEDLAGALLAGSPDDIEADLNRLITLGCNLVVIDLRFRFADWLSQIRILGEELLPRFRSAR